MFIGSVSFFIVNFERKFSRLTNHFYMINRQHYLLLMYLFRIQKS